MFTVTPAAIVAGQSVTLSWQTSNATSLVINNSFAVQPASGGTLTLPSGQTPAPTQTTTYTAVAQANGQQAMATATVTVSPLNSADGMLPDATNLDKTDIDPTGAVGTKQFIEYVNTEYQAFDKKTMAPVTINGASSSGPQLIGTPWAAPLNTTSISECSGSGIQLDTMIVFDRLASRWVISAKAVRAGNLKGTPIQAYSLCIAVSNTDDVTSKSPPFGWYAYSYSLDTILPLVVPAPKPSYYLFPDWPKLGTWQDAYYVALDMQDNQNGSAELGVAVCAFNRTLMLTGVPPDVPPANQLTACATETSPIDTASKTYLAHSLIPADIDGSTPPPSGQPEYLVSIQNPDFSQSAPSSTMFNLWEAQVVWPTTTGTLPSLTLTQTTVPTSYIPGCYLFVPGAPAITNCVPEPSALNIGQHVDSVGDRFMPRFAYRNFSNSATPYGSFLVSHTVQTGVSGPNSFLTQTGVRWYELRSTGAGIPSLFQSGTINPDTVLFRFLPSIAQDKDGNAAVGYSVSSPRLDPGINFSYWNLGTPNAQSTEVTILAGAGEEETSGNGVGQWGTYSSMTVDPVDDCTFWYVNEYWPTDSAWATRIANFKLPGCQ